MLGINSPQAVPVGMTTSRELCSLASKPGIKDFFGILRGGPSR